MDINNFEKLLKETNIILMNKQSVLFFGILSYGMTKQIISESEADHITERIFGTKFSIGGFVTGNAKEITYVCNDISTNDIITITIHEIIHIISDHINRRGTRDPIIWNLAVDHVTNREIRSMKKKSTFIGDMEKLVFFEDIHKKCPKIIPEDLYDMLKNNKNMTITEYMMGGGKKIIEIEYDGKKMYATNDAYIKLDQNEKEMRDFINKSKMIWNSPSINKGNMSESIVSYLDDVFEVEIHGMKYFGMLLCMNHRQTIMHHGRE